MISRRKVMAEECPGSGAGTGRLVMFMRLEAAEIGGQV